MYLVYTWYIPGIYFGVFVGIYQVYTRYIPGLEITRYIPGIYLLYTSYIAEVGLYPVYTRYIPGKFHFYRFQMLPSSARAGPPATHMQERATHSPHDLHSHPLAGHHSSITPGTLNGPGLPAAITRSTDTAPPYQTAGPTPCRVAPPRSQRSPGRTARTGLAVSRSCPTEHGRLGALPHAACPCSNLTLATTQT